MQNKKIFKIRPKNVLLAIVVSASLFALGFLFGKYHGTSFNPPLDVTVFNRQISHQDVDFSLFWRVWDILKDKFLFRNLDAKKMLYGAISGLVNAAGDPYTAFLTPDQNKEVKEGLNGTYEGIGAELGMEETQLIIVSPLDGSPAKEANLKPKDKILKIDGQPTSGIAIMEAVSKIRGKDGTEVTLTVQRDEETPFDVKLVRRKISVPSVTLKIEDSNIAYVRISRFGDDTNGQWNEIRQQLEEKSKNGEIKGIILDVRGNPGGYLNSAFYIAEDFVGEGKVVLWQEGPSGRRQALKSERVAGLVGEKIVVLIDEGSASASEILAAALRDDLKTPLVGKKSFGKGTVQDAQDFEDGSGLHITVAKWLTPDGVWIDKDGLKPDIEVALDEEAYKNGEDTQLKKALEQFK